VKKDPKIFIGHIIESIQLVEEYSLRLTAEKFKTDRALQDAIIRRLEIIGEAVKNLSATFNPSSPALTMETVMKLGPFITTS
jgi:uncharacterized protein with HEPN domain